jgi:hypothetical protein
MRRYQRSNLNIKTNYIERVYSATSDSIHTILGSLVRSGVSLLNEYKFIRLSYVDGELFTTLSQELNYDFLILVFFIIKVKLKTV